MNATLVTPRQLALHGARWLRRARERSKGVVFPRTSSSVPLTLRRRAGSREIPTALRQWSLGVGPRICPFSVENGDSGSNPTAQAFPANRVNVLAAPSPERLSHHSSRDARSTTGPDDPDPSGETTMVLQCQPTLSTTCVPRPALRPAFGPSAAVPLSPTGLFPAQPMGGVPRGPPRTGDSSLGQEPSRVPPSEASTPVVVGPSFAPLGLRGALRTDLGPARSGLERPEPGAFHHQPMSDRSRPPTRPRERDRGRL